MKLLRALEASGSLSGFGNIGVPINPVCLKQVSGVVALVLHNHIVQYTARAYDVLDVSEVIDSQWEFQDPKSFLENTEHPIYYLTHGLAPAHINQSL